MREISRVAGFSGVHPWSRHFFVGFLLAVSGVAGGTSAADAQMGTLGAGAMFIESNTDPVAEIYLGAPPVHEFRAYGIGSWTDESWSPTFITAVERVVLPTDYSFTTLGAGAVWLEFKDYEPDFILTSTTVVPLPFAPSLSFVVVGSTQPFQDFDWTIVTKLAVTLFFKK